MLNRTRNHYPISRSLSAVEIPEQSDPLLAYGAARRNSQSTGNLSKMFFNRWNPWRNNGGGRGGGGGGFNNSVYVKPRQYLSKEYEDLPPANRQNQLERTSSLSKIYIRDPNDDKRLLVAEEIGYIYGDIRDSADPNAIKKEEEAKAKEEENKKEQKAKAKKPEKKRKTTIKGFSLGRRNTKKKSEVSTVSGKVAKNSDKVSDRLFKGDPVKTKAKTKADKSSVTNLKKKSKAAETPNKFRSIASAVLNKQRVMTAFSRKSTDDDDMIINHDKFLDRLHLGPLPPNAGDPRIDSLKLPQYGAAGAPVGAATTGRSWRPKNNLVDNVPRSYKGPGKAKSSFRNIRRGDARDAVLDMPLMATPDIIVSEPGGEVTESYSGNNDKNNNDNNNNSKKGGAGATLPIVMLQGFFKGGGGAGRSKSSNHRRPSIGGTRDMPLPQHLIDVTSKLKGALPLLPQSWATLCLLLNILIPGFGTMMSGVFGMCVGRNRMSSVEDPSNKLKALFITIVTGLVQLFTVSFFFVGWFWGVAWGIILVSIARKYQVFISEHRSSIAGSMNMEMLTVNAS